MKKTNRLLAVLLSLVLLCSGLPFAFAEDDATIYGTDGDLVWTLDNKGVLTINGEGPMSDNLWRSWLYHADAIAKAVIKDGVTSIGDMAFIHCTSLTSVTIPDSVTSISSNAFSDCAALTSVTIPNSVMSIGSSAFYNCDSLESVEIPNSVRTLGRSENYDSSYGVFYDCDNLKTVSIGDDLTVINPYTFYSCDKLETVTIGNSVTSIGDDAFFGCSALASVKLPEGIKTIGGSTFSGCSALTSIAIPDGVTRISNAAFSGCTSLTSVTIPDSVDYIGNVAFFDCRALTCITIPYGVATINIQAFSGCSALTSITIPDSVWSIDDAAFSDCSALPNVTIPNSVASIGPDAFRGCSNLESITILNGMCTIADSANAISPTATIISYDNTEAQAYAEKYGRTFISLGEYTHEHTPVVREEPGTCKTKGYRLTTCSVCGEQLSYEATTYGDHVFEVYERWGDCEKGGTVVYRCSFCGKIKEEELLVGEHQFNEWEAESNNNGLCSESYEYRTCIICGKQEKRNEISTHKWLEYERRNNCEDGAVHYQCEKCGMKRWEYLPTMPHQLGDWIIDRNPTCTESGYRYQICEVCGSHVNGESIAPTGHAFGAWSRFVMVEDAAYEVEIRFCNTCGYYELRQADPANPTEPTEPTTPTEPTDPTDPTNPTSPTDPTEPTNPTNPTEPVTEPTGEAERDPDACAWCGQVHEGFFQRIVGWFHSILANLFGAKY